MTSPYPLMLYRNGDDIEWDGRKVGVRTVTDADDHETALADGWAEAADFLNAEANDRSLLDCTAKEIEAALPSLDLEELETLKTAEEAGKTRKGVLASISAAIDAKLAG